MKFNVNKKSLHFLRARRENVFTESYNINLMPHKPLSVQLLYMISRNLYHISDERCKCTPGRNNIHTARL